MQWSVTNEQDAQAMLPENNMQDGIYKGTVDKAIVMPGRQREDGSIGNDWLKLDIKFETPAGTIFGGAAIFDSARMFFVRKHFWESAGEPEKVNASSSEYVGKKIEAKCKVENYTAKTGEIKKKLVVVDFIGESAKEEKFIDDDIKF